MKTPSAKSVQDQFVVIEGFRMLQEKKAYKQVNVLKKLITLEKEVSPTSFSNILKGKTVGPKVLAKAAAGMLEILSSELGYVFELSTAAFILDEGLAAAPKLIEEYDDRMVGQGKGVFFRTDGRLSINEKVAFLELAQKEIVEVGIRLNTFSNYFFTRKEKDFALPIKNRLAENINIKLYLLNPDYNGTHFYFTDRATAQEEEGQSVERIKTVIQKLKKIYRDYDFASLPGRFEVYTYRHLPYGHFLIVDGSSWNGKMIFSQYLYGIPRAHCPSVEVAKVAAPDLYKKYWTSYKMLVKNAKQLDLTSKLQS